MDSTSTARPLWRLLLLANEPEKPIQLSCEECFALLEYDADVLEAGAPLDKVRALVMRHLSLCSECQTKFNDWLTTHDEYAPASIGS